MAYLEVPPHAVVHRAVDQVPQREARRFGPLVNAVLRRLSERGTDILTGLDAVRVDTPDWLWDAWSRFYGEQRCRDLAAASRHPAPLDLTLNTAKAAAADPADWAARLGGEPLPTGGLRLLAGGDPTLLEGFGDGAWWVQDAAAALPVRLFGPVAGLRILDLCAAPGGKTAQLAAAGARVTALDRSAARMKRLSENFTRLGLSVELVVADAEGWRPETLFDAVLLDAPCSATGTLRRHPDIAWLKSGDDVAKLADLQRRLLGASVRMVRPGGQLVYCTCSLQPEEGELQAKNFLGSGAPVEPDPIGPDAFPGLDQAITAEGWLRTLPSFWADKGGMDGFFAARFRRS